ncbi:MAG: hypothetical protein IT358_10590 [Gemmatimonadaceae bacterium]|nr:hypothetical protein [Gemmatimonadota bacterium]MCC7324269.1 hypothetical protein [Gemmatimonadaceae bacterium]HNV74168.1 hypothetical protein [Gemmatimonadaceae bacterium]HPV77649.1 hypothetical protein [Gemmatimonadaceae bacterium]
MTRVHAPSPSHPWHLLQGAMLLATLAFLVAVWLSPEPSLSLFWGVVVPLLPFSFLVTPLLWRGVCPLATLNMLANTPGGRRLPSRVSRWAGAPAMLALFVLVPARHFAFNVRGEALALLVVGAAVAAVVLGRRYEARAGFCNYLCPVLPVEQLYGLQPSIAVDNPRCATCSACTPRGCLDNARSKAVAQLLGPARRGRGWLLSAFGLFAIAFPGFVYGYFNVSDAEASAAWTIYAHMLEHALQSAALFGTLIFISGATAALALPLLSAIAAGTYYWYAVPVILKALHVLSPAATLGGRVVVAVFLAWWLQRALRLTAREARTTGTPESSRELPTLVVD